MATACQYKTKNVCASMINFELEGNVVKNVSFQGGCNGNLKAISKLVEGMTVEQIENYLKGNTCGKGGASCADVLAQGVRKAHEEANE